jgi:predicted Zn-dependent peptidase
MRHSVEEVKLKNGARGLFVDVPGASVMSYKVCFKAGFRYTKGHEVYEVAHLLEHMAFGRNAKFRDERAYEAEFTKNGAYHNAWTSDALIRYEAECADFEWERIFNLQRVAICQPRFNEEELLSEKGNVKAEISGYLNDYWRLLWPRLQKDVGEDVLLFSERVKTLKNIALADVREHYRRTHTARNMRFVIVGKLKGRKKKLISMLENWELKEGEELSLPADDLKSSEATLVRRKDANNISFGFSWILPRQIGTREMFMLESLNHIWNGTMYGRMLGAARQRGLIYSMGSSVSANERASSWDFDGEVDEDKAGALFDLIDGEMRRLFEVGVDAEDIERAKSYALGRHQMNAQTVGQISEYYSGDYFTTGEILEYEKIPALIRQMNAGEIVEVAKDFMYNGIRGMASVGNVEARAIKDLSERIWK